jgi:hypothetical protein
LFFNLSFWTCRAGYRERRVTLPSRTASNAYVLVQTVYAFMAPDCVYAPLR